ncbi:flagellar basal body P-ring protein FlgI [Pseudomonas aeruginosa]|uniref:flagellar basal body P-ring protein FlgI n=1 Tax=Pseudomonas aeruginosa TaxID=287 RepID=UPI0009A476FC|nr:flagellar basal body P-ring protein FlgI [Pseudomonas aeruginosa]
MTKFKHLLALAALLLAAGAAQAERLKDIASIQGVRTNQLIGYGLVVGLSGSGDQTTQTPFTLQTFNNMLAQFGIKVPANVGNVQLKNVAAVSVHADLPPFAKPGQPIDVTVSSIGNAKSLRGGSLLMTPLKGIDGQVYAVAQGNLVVGGFDAEGRDGSKITVNVPSAGRIPAGATVERAVPSGFDQGNSLTLNLNRPDFTTAKRIVDRINELLGPGVAHAVDGGSVRVSAPLDPNQRVDYLSILENLDVQPGEAVAKVIINSRTGTIVIGLAAVIVGESILPSRRLILATLAVILGAIVYRFFIALALNSDFIGLQAQDLNLVTAVLVTVALVIPMMKKRLLGKKGA